MSKEVIDDSEWQEWIEFLDEYNRKKQLNKEKFQESLLYSIYKWLKSKENGDRHD